MKYVLILLSLLVSQAIVAQTGIKSVVGAVCDNKDKRPVIGAIVQALNPHDSTSYSNLSTTTDTDGRFRIKLGAQKYILKFQTMGYENSYSEVDLSLRKEVNLETIFLRQNSIMLRDTEVYGVVPPILVRGDTIEFNASSYTSNENDLLNDLLKRVPGIEVDSHGNITANGKPVSKILVDGKEFFGNDMVMALNNLPANMINKLQLFKEESDEAKMTGMKDKDPAQVLNLQVKDELKRSVFGNLSVGYGSNNKYSHKGLANYMNNDDQISVVAEMNNVNPELNFGNSGVSKNQNLGINFYRQSSEKMKLGGFARYSNNTDLEETKDNSFNFGLDRYTKQNTTNRSATKAFNTGVNMDWRPDSATTIYARASVTYSDTEQNNQSTNMSYVLGKDTTSGFSSLYAAGDNVSLNGSVYANRKLGSKGRNVGVMFNTNIRYYDTKGANFSETYYPDVAAPTIVDQLLTNNNKTNTYSFSISYVEPLGKNQLLQVKYEVSNTSTNREKEARRKDNVGLYSVIDTAYSRHTETNYLNQVIGTTYQLVKEKYNLTVGFDFLPTRSKSEISFKDAILESIEQEVINYSPNLNFSYNPTSSSSINFSYIGTTEQPGVMQLSGDTIIIDALTKHVGNPDLKPSYDNTTSIYYQKSDFESGRFLMLTGGFKYGLNTIVDYYMIDENGNTIQSYKNVDGNMGANAGILYSTPLRNKKLTFDSNTSANYYRRIGFTNQDKSISNNVSLGQMLSIKFQSKKIDINLGVNVTHNIITNNLESVADRTNTNYRLVNDFALRLPYDFTIENFMEYTYYAGYENDFKTSQFIWNATITKNLLKKKKGSIRLQLFDILDDRNPITRITTGNSYSDSHTNSVNRYFLISFAYRFNIAKGTPAVDDDMNGEYF